MEAGSLPGNAEKGTEPWFAAEVISFSVMKASSRSALCVLGYRTHVHNPSQCRPAPGLCLRAQFPALAYRSDPEVECLWIDLGGCINP